MDKQDRDGISWQQRMLNGPTKRPSRWTKGATIAAVAGILMLMTGIVGCSVGPGFEIEGPTWYAWDYITSGGGFAMLLLGFASLINAGTFTLFAQRSAVATAIGIILLIASIAPAFFGLASLIGAISGAITAPG